VVSKNADSMEFTNLSTKKPGEVQLTCKVLLVGDKLSGKTSLVKRYSTGNFHENIPDTGIDFVVQHASCKGIDVRLKVWDSGNVSSWDSFKAGMYKSSNCVVICHDITDPHAKKSEWLQEVDCYAQPNTLKVFAGCKSDLPHEVSLEHVELDADESGTTYFDTSAKEGTNVDLMFETIAEKCVDLYHQQNKAFQIVGASSWYNHVKINGRYALRWSDSNRKILSPSNMTYYNVDFPGPEMIYNDKHWIIKINKKILAALPCGPRDLPYDESIQSAWTENYGVYFQQLHQQSAMRCELLPEPVSTSPSPSPRTTSVTCRSDSRSSSRTLSVVQGSEKLV